MSKAFWLLLFLIACSTSLYQPIGLGIPPHVNSEARNAAIRRGTYKAGWLLEEQGEGEFLVSYREEEEYTVVHISQVGKVLQLKFYEIEGERDTERLKKLHSFEYNRNMLKLEEQIALELARIF